jgi:hypothetical protein
MAFLYYFATYLVAVVMGLLQINRETDDDTRRQALYCPCYHAWRPLDARWALLRANCSDIAWNLSWTTLSAACAAVGGVFGWFFGYPFLRVPLDEAHFNQASYNDAHYGCVQGERALVRVYGPTVLRCGGSGPDPNSLPEKWCPTRARLQCATVHWAAAAPT